MLKNNNSTSVKRIGKRLIKNNRVRNIFSVLAIILTTVMFTTVFTICFSIYKNIDIMFTRQQGSAANIYITHPTDEIINEVKKLPSLNAVGIQVFAGAVCDAQDSGNYIYLNYYDETEFEKHFMPAISDVKGHYPIKENELMLAMSALDALGIENPEEGMILNLKFDDGSRREFVLSGWYKDYMNFSGSKGGLVSKKYIEACGIDTTKDGRLCMSSKRGQDDKLIDELDGIGDDSDFSYMDSGSVKRSNAFEIFALAAVLGIIIVFSGYLLIYNIMYISVSNDVRFYGLLKTIGVSPRQIKSIVRSQVMRLSVIGLPVGMAIGSVVSFFVMPVTVDMFQAGNFSAMPKKIYFNVFIFAATLLFVLLTIVVSCRKPARLAGNVSPVEAVKFTGVYSGKAKSKKTTGGGKPYRMAYRNVFREKKRVLLVFTSLFMGTIAFLSMNTFFKGLDLENYANMYLPYDYTINCHISNAQNGYDKMREQSLKLSERLGEIDGVINISINKGTDVLLDFDRETYMPFLEVNESWGGGEVDDVASFYETNTDPEAAYRAHVVTADEWTVKRYCDFSGENIDMEAFLNGDVCIMGVLDEREAAKRMNGKTLTLISEENNERIDIKVASCVITKDSSFFQFAEHRFMGGAPHYLIVSDRVMERLGENYIIDTIIMECDKDSEPYVTGRVKEMTENSDTVSSADIKTELLKELKGSIGAMKMLTDGVSFLLILIGIINFINVMMTGVYSRRKEFALLESVGMSKKQVKKMLVLEGIYYGIITIGLVATIGNGIIYIVSRLTGEVVDYAIPVYPLAELIIMSAFILAVCTLIPALLYKSISKETLTERLRIE